MGNLAVISAALMPVYCSSCLSRERKRNGLAAHQNVMLSEAELFLTIPQVNRPYSGDNVECLRNRDEFPNESVDVPHRTACFDSHGVVEK
jgi:hypothetical protein